MVKLLPLARGAYERQYGKMPPVRCHNRFFENNPTNRVAGTALLSRMGSTFLEGFGAGPIRANYSQDGTFSGALFTVSGDTLFRLDRDLTKLEIGGIIAGTGTPAMVGTKDYLFIADGASLQVYDGNGSRATGVLTLTANAANTETVTINGVVYTFKTTLLNPYDVLIGSNMEESLQNLADCINAQPETSNIAYQGPVTANAFVTAGWSTTDDLTVYAKTGGTAGNAYTTTDTLANGAWGGATLSGGVDDALFGTPTPDDVGIVSLAVLKGFVLCAAAQSQRIYFIRPGSFLIDPLDFFEAESIPDEISSLMTVGDQVWAFGTQSTDVFYLTGENDVPFAPIEGRAFSRGILEGTAALLSDSEVAVVGNDNIVYVVAGGPRRVSNSGVEELIRRAREAGAV